MVLVEMLTSTNYSGFKKVGIQCEVPKEVAIRWANMGIAKIIENVEEGSNDFTPAGPYDGLTSKDLYKLAKSKGLDVLPNKSRNFYIRRLEAN